MEMCINFYMNFSYGNLYRFFWPGSTYIQNNSLINCLAVYLLISYNNYKFLIKKPERIFENDLIFKFCTNKKAFYKFILWVHHF